MKYLGHVSGCRAERFPELPGGRESCLRFPSPFLPPCLSSKSAGSLPTLQCLLFALSFAAGSRSPVSPLMLWPFLSSDGSCLSALQAERLGRWLMRPGRERAVLGGKAGSVPGLSAPFLIRPNELRYNSAKKGTPATPAWVLGPVALSSDVDDPGQKMVGVPLPQRLEMGCSRGAGVWGGGWRAGCWGFPPSPHLCESLRPSCCKG